MSNDVTTRFNGNGAAQEFGVATVDADAMARALQGVKREAATGAQMYLRFQKTGQWTFGAESEPVPADATFAVDPFSFIHGYVAWGDLQKLGEAVLPLTTPLPQPPAPPAGSRGWEQQLGFMVKHAYPQDEASDLGVLIFRTSSFGGRKAIAALAAECGARMARGEPAMPIIKLTGDSYQHKKWGRIFEPNLVIVSWIGGVEGLLEGVESPAAKKAAKKAKPAARKAAR